MRYRSTRQVVEDLRRHGRLVECDEPLDARLEIAEVQRRVYARGGPAVYFSRPANSLFPMVSNLFGTIEQARFLFRDTIEAVRRAIELKVDPSALAKNPWRYRSAPWVAWTMLPRRGRRAAVLEQRISLSRLPQLVSWPLDGGHYVTLPQVLSQSPEARGLQGLNLGMYRVQLGGNVFDPETEVGLHYQIHRGIGVHHQLALQQGKPLPVAITVGGTPAMTLAAVMPLPEGMSELMFAGALAGGRIPMHLAPNQAPIYADADFVLAGQIDPGATKPEGPFGDHLGYYSLRHPFPLMRVQVVSHRKDAVWPFTVVGRPPQEDTTFGQLIHELTGPVLPTVLPGVRAVHAVDEAGVHPLLLAIGSERYTPFRRADRPQELLTQANAILGQGQLSLAKYLWILDGNSAPQVDLHDTCKFLQEMLRRVQWHRDLHFQTQTTIDTLDYSGDRFQGGSKVVIAARGPAVRTLGSTLPADAAFPAGFRNPRVAAEGILLLEGPSQGVGGMGSADLEESTWPTRDEADSAMQRLSESLTGCHWRDAFPLVLVVDDADWASKSNDRWIWLAFTRSDPAADLHGAGQKVINKHWGCDGPLLIDARRKRHHAPPLLEDPEVSRKIDALAARGGPLARYL
jgi:4-hydroxy-3-polyprenylbenzoate decarboxylase